MIKNAVFFLAIFFVLNGCSDFNPNYEENVAENLDDGSFKMQFVENIGWNEDGHEEWSRWMYVYEDASNPFDLSNMYTNNKVYVFNYSFRADVDIDLLGVFFYCDNPGWEMITDWTSVKGNIKKYTIYTGRTILIPRSNASGRLPANTHLRFDIGRSVVFQPTLSFYNFSFEIKDKEIGSEEKYTTNSGEEFDIQNTAFAENLPTYEGETDVLSIKPSYDADNYGGYVIQYDLSAYAGKKINIAMSMDAWLETPARVAWQINSSTPYYPVICGTVAPDWHFPNHSGDPLTANEWHHITGNNTIIVPTTNGDSGKILFLSDEQLDGAKLYLANLTIAITDCTETVNFDSVTANGSSSEPINTTQLTLNFSQAITGLKEDDITISGVNGVIKRRLKPPDSVSGTAYTLDIIGFTSSGTLTVTVKKDGYNISGSQTVTIFYYPTVNFNNVTADGSASEPKTTTQLTLNFSQAISGLSESNITLSGMSGVIKGTLSGEGPTYTLPISGITASGTLTVTVTSPDCIINNSPKTVNIIYSAFDSAVGIKELTIHNYNIITTVDTNTGIITKERNSDYGNWFSVAIPGNLTITTDDMIVVKYICFGDAPLIVKLPNSYEDVSGKEYPVFIGDQTERTFEIDASRYGSNMPNTPNAVLTFQGMRYNSVAWKLKIISITVRPK